MRSFRPDGVTERFAYLIGGATRQVDIANMLGVDEGNVSRWRRRAEERGLLGYYPTLPPASLEAIRREFSIQGGATLENIGKTVAKRLKTVARVCVCPPFPAFPRTAAFYLYLVLESALMQGVLSSACVAWGEVSGHTLQELELYCRYWPLAGTTDFPIECTAARGEFLATLEPAEREYTCSANAMLLAAILNGESTAQNTYTLAGLPAVVPQDLAEVLPKAMLRDPYTGSDVVWAIFSEMLKRCWPANDKFDLILTGVGSSSATSPVTRSQLGLRGFENPDIAKNLAGDIAGIWLRRRDTRVPDEIADEIARSRVFMLGLSADHLAACRRRASRLGREGTEVLPCGVIVLAAGDPAKSDAIIAAAHKEEHLISTLICDIVVAEAILKSTDVRRHPAG